MCRTILSRNEGRRAFPWDVPLQIPINLYNLQSDILIFQVFLQQLMILRPSGLWSKASKTMQMAVNLQVMSGELLRV